MKKDLIELYTKKENITFVQTKEEVNLFFQTLMESIAKEKVVKFKGIGTFEAFEKIYPKSTNKRKNAYPTTRYNKISCIC